MAAGYQGVAATRGPCLLHYEHQFTPSKFEQLVQLKELFWIDIEHNPSATSFVAMHLRA